MSNAPKPLSVGELVVAALAGGSGIAVAGLLLRGRTGIAAIIFGAIVAVVGRILQRLAYVYLIRPQETARGGKRGWPDVVLWGGLGAIAIVIAVLFVNAMVNHEAATRAVLKPPRSANFR